MPVAQFSSGSLRQPRQPDLERVGFSLAGRGLAVLVSLLLFCAFTSAGCGFTSNNPAKQIKLAAYSLLCVDVTDESTANEAEVQIYPCTDGRHSQEWLFQPVGNTDQFYVVNVNSQMCMSVLDAPDTATHQKVVQESCAYTVPKTNQIWSIAVPPKAEAGYQVISAASNQCLDLPDGSIATYFQMQQYPCRGFDVAQGWILDPVAAGD
jgi:hypothetical protein